MGRWVQTTRRRGWLLFIPVAIGAGLWGLVAAYSAWIAEGTPDDPEAVYYKELIYTVNEMNNQVKNIEQQLNQEGAVEAEDILHARREVAERFERLNDPPEKYAVSQQIAADMYRSYIEYADSMSRDTAFISHPRRSELLEEVEVGFADFQYNYEVLKIMYQFKGIDVVCH